MCADSTRARSSIDAATVRDDPGDGDDNGAAVDEAAELEAGGDERLEPAALDVPMASVPVTAAASAVTTAGGARTAAVARCARWKR